MSPLRLSEPRIKPSTLSAGGLFSSLLDRSNLHRLDDVAHEAAVVPVRRGTRAAGGYLSSGRRSVRVADGGPAGREQVRRTPSVNMGRSITSIPPIGGLIP